MSTEPNTQTQAREMAAMRGHTEAKARLEGAGWTQAEIGSLEDAVRGYGDFARCVVDELRWQREKDESDD